MKIKNLLEARYSRYDIQIDKHIGVVLSKDSDNVIHSEYYCDIDPLDSGIWYELKITLTGEETISQVRKIVKAYMMRKGKTSNTKVIKSCYNEFNYDEYSMTMRSTKEFVNALKKYFKVGNEFILNDMGIYGLTQCAMYLGY